nr:MAG TPA: hypothetical protein [Caudoviricetes sp.]
MPCHSFVCVRVRSLSPPVVCVRAGAPLGGGGVPGTPRKEAVRRPSPNTRLYCKFPECRTLAPLIFLWSPAKPLFKIFPT